MTSTILLVLAILALTVVLFVTERVRADLVALLVLLALAITRVLSPAEALAGFANPVVITLASVLVLSQGLLRTGVASRWGRRWLRRAGDGEGRLVAVLMLTVGVFSGVMHDVGVAALMLPVVLGVARRLDRPASKLLLPLAFGSLLGGMTTLIGNAPNVLLSGALDDHGFEPFGVFDFTPVGAAALAVGVGYMALFGHRLLPERRLGLEVPPATREELARLHGLRQVLFTLVVPDGSALDRATLADSRLGSALGLTVLAVERGGNRTLAPGPDTELRSGDTLLVEGRRERLEALRGWRHLVIEEEDDPDRRRGIEELSDASFAEVVVGDDREIVGKTVAEADLRWRYGVQALAIIRGTETRDDENRGDEIPDDTVHVEGLRGLRLEAGDTLLATGPRRRLEELQQVLNLRSFRFLTASEVGERYRLSRQLLGVRVPEGSLLAGAKLAETRLGDAFGLTVLGIVRGGESHLLPEPGEALEAGDTLLLQGRRRELDLLRSLQELELVERRGPRLEELESPEVGAAEVVIPPRSGVAGRTLGDLLFRERFGLTVLAVWRGGRSHRSGLASLELRPGDAFLVYGPREKLLLLDREPDFQVLTEGSREVPREKLAPRAAAILAAVVAVVVAGVLPIYLAAPTGAALMVLGRCLTMEEAYRAVEWRTLLLVAGMLSLGVALQDSGAAELIARTVLGAMAFLGPRGVVAGLFAITALAVQVLPTPAVAVLMAPVALATAADLGLSPHALLMVVAVSSSCAFMSPLGHPVNLLVMGVGGYRFTDYLKVGWPLVLLLFFVVLFVLPLVWPLAG